MEGAAVAELDSQAVVFGAGMAGLLAARVLSEFYGSVTVVERDLLPDHPGQRKGVPQGRHLHHFLSRGTQILGELFPGLLDELAATGATVDDGDDLSRLHVRVAGYELNPAGKLADPGPLAAYQASRPFMEFHLRRRVAALANVTVFDNHEAVEPVMAADTVTGARIINHDNGITITVNADLVVDATGRAARTPAFLESHGFGAPPEERIPSIGGYSSQLMRIPPGRITERLAFVNQGSRAPGALLVAYEHDTWMLAIARPAEDGSPHWGDLDLPKHRRRMATLRPNAAPPSWPARARRRGVQPQSSVRARHDDGRPTGVRVARLLASGQHRFAAPLLPRRRWKYRTGVGGEPG
jgi:hypothetical protein